LFRYFCLRTFGSREHPVKVIARKTAAIAALHKPPHFAIRMPGNCPNHLKIDLSIAVCTKVLSLSERKKLPRLLSQRSELKRAPSGLRSRQTPVDTRFGNLPEVSDK